MSWLWLISVGVSDVQFPVWSKDEYGRWSHLRRFETGRAGVRAMHEGLLVLLRNGQIRFDTALPEPIDRLLARDLRLEFDQDGEAFLAAIRHPDYRLSNEADTIPNQREDKLPLYCPKVDTLLPLARETFGDHRVAVLVLNTRRAEDFSEAAAEPVASGPLVAQCLAERLHLEWIDGQGEVPERLNPGTATWMDVLKDHEAVEQRGAQDQVVRRLGAAIRAWSPNATTASRVVVTTSGGMPPLKPLIERVPATALGPGRVLLLDQPERGPAAAQPLSYDSRVAEREVLRYHCAEALRNGDYAGAYGLASRAIGQPWANTVRDGLGSLLELPGTPLRIGGRALAPFALAACRVEVRLCMNDALGALIRLATFIESTVWELIGGDARLARFGLVVDRDDECLVGELDADHGLFRDELLERDKKGADHHRVLSLNRGWVDWLQSPEGGQQDAAETLRTLGRCYGGKPRRFRNQLMHGSDMPVEPEEVKRSMKDAKLVSGVACAFGKNFFAVPEVGRLLGLLGEKDLPAAVDKHLQAILNRVIEG